MAARYQHLGDGIYCIDTDLYRPSMAACYLVREGDAVAFVDTGTYHTVPLLMGVLADLGLGAENVRYVIPTHVHLDHGRRMGKCLTCMGAVWCFTVRPDTPTTMVVFLTRIHGNVSPGIPSAFLTASLIQGKARGYLHLPHQSRFLLMNGCAVWNVWRLCNPAQCP